MTDFRFGAARRLYAGHQHPRVYFGAADLTAIRRNIQSGDGLKIATAYRKNARAAVESVLAAGEGAALVEALCQKGAHLMGRAMDMAARAVLDGDAEATEAARRLLAAAPEIEPRTPLDGQPRHRLGCSASGSLALAYDLIQPQLSEAERRAFCAWACQYAVKKTLDELLPHYYWVAGMNIPIGGLRSAVYALMAIDGEPGLPDLAPEWERALPMVEATLNTVLGPDGYPEEDMGYGTGTFAAVAQIAEALRRAGRLDPYAVSPRYAKFGDAVLHLLQPWGENLSTTGDHGDDFGGRVFVLARLARETKNPTLTWLLGDLPYHPDSEIQLRKGFQVENSLFSLLLADQFKGGVHPARAKPPISTHFRDRRRGIVTFRSGWKPEDTFVVFDGSQRCPAAQGHEHASCGHFSISAFGEYFAIDTGRYNIEQNCHNVTLIDGKSGRSTDGEWISVKHAGVLTGFAPDEFVDTASVDSSLQHNCMWARRTLGLVKGREAPAYVWVVDDINKNNDWGEYWWQLHTCPENTIRLYKSRATITGWRHGNQMDAHFALPAPADFPRAHEWLGFSQDEVEPSSY